MDDDMTLFSNLSQLNEIKFKLKYICKDTIKRQLSKLVDLLHLNVTNLQVYLTVFLIIPARD